MPTTPTPATDCPAAADEASTSKTAKVPAFSFPFSPAAFAPSKNDGQPHHPKGHKSNHDKIPGRAPNGTRRSMGKR